jgi:hypothetical protein
MQTGVVLISWRKEVNTDFSKKKSLKTTKKGNLWVVRIKLTFLYKRIIQIQKKSITELKHFWTRQFFLRSLEEKW